MYSAVGQLFHEYLTRTHIMHEFVNSRSRKYECIVLMVVEYDSIPPFLYLSIVYVPVHSTVHCPSLSFPLVSPALVFRSYGV
jgi:hypothetical protein